jgi:hypothetical protein
MAHRSFIARMTIAAVGIALLSAVFSSVQYGGETPVESGTAKKKGPVIEEKDRVPVEVARDRAKLMHDIYTATLDVMHHRYFHREKSVVPARAMEDVFDEIKLSSKSEARWIAVNLRAMSIDHEPETDFEKQAVREIVAGKSDVEIIEAGYYRRATVIPLHDGCISCHEGTFRQPTKNPKFAGLVISIPVTEEAKAAAPVIAP